MSSARSAGSSSPTDRRSIPCVIPCASRAEKLWPVDGWRAIVARCERAGLQVAVLWGSPAEQQLARQVAAGSSASLPPFLTVREAAGLLGHAHVVVGLDTGFTHLAAAFARPTVGIYCDHEPGLATADLDPARIAAVRAANPSLANRRYRVVPVPAGQRSA